MNPSIKNKWLFLFLLVILPSPRSVPATGTDETMYSSWHIYWDGENTNAATELYGPKLDHICAFGVHFDPSGRLISAFPSLSKTLAFLRENDSNGRIVLTAVNDVVGGKRNKLKDPEAVHAAISDSKKRAAHIKELMTLGADFDGIEIDYEKVRPDDRNNFSRFIAELAEEVHKKGKSLSVVVEPKTSDTGGIDWAAVSKSADMVKIMAYYLHFPGGESGPVAPTAWVEELAVFAKTQIPIEKLTMVLVMNGARWSQRDKSALIDYASATQLAAQKKVAVKRDRRSRSPTFQYKDDTGRNEVWFEDQTSLNEKVAMLKRNGVTHIGLWRLGSGDPAFWGGLGRGKRRTEPVLQ